MPEPYALTWTVEDQAGKTATFTEFIASGLTLAQMTEGALAHAPLIDGIIGGIIRGAEICIGVDLSGLTGNVAAGTSDVEEVGEFVFVTAQNREVRVNLPCMNDTASIVGSDDLDQADVNVDAFIDAMVAGLTVVGGNMSPVDVDENDITAVKIARERVRNSGSRS